MELRLEGERHNYNLYYIETKKEGLRIEGIKTNGVGSHRSQNVTLCVFEGRHEVAVIYDVGVNVPI